MLLKKMMLMLLTIVFISGLSLEANASENKILGLWKYNPEKSTTEKNTANTTFSTYFYFAKEGVFALPEQAMRAGISWKLSKDDVLTLVSSSASEEFTPADSVSGDSTSLNFVPLGTNSVNTTHEEIFKLVSLKKNEMVLQNTRAERITLEKMNDAVFHISGKMMYRERMALPPLVETQVQLYENGKPFALSFMQKSGQVPLPFSVYFLKREKNAKITLDASISHGYSKMFATIKPVEVAAAYIGNSSKQKAEPKRLDVLLYRSMDSKLDPKLILYPAAYESKNGDYTLYLEAGGFGILKDKKSTETIYWNQVDRNYKLAIMRAGKDPLFVSVKSEKELVFTNLKGKDSVIFSKINENFSEEKISLTGMYTEMGSKGYFTDCNSQKQFVLDFAKNKKLHEAYLGLDAPVGLATLEVLISRDDNSLALNVKKFKSLDKSKRCGSIFKNAELTDTYWRLVTLNGKAVEKYQDQKEAHFTIRDNQVNGSDGCNNFFMPATIDGNEIKFGIGGSTMMMCPQGDAQTREFLQTLNKVNTWKINGSVLQLEEDDEIKLTFEVVYF